MNNDVAFVARKLDYQPKDLERFMDATYSGIRIFRNEKLLGLCYDAFRFLSGVAKPQISETLSPISGLL